MPLSQQEKDHFNCFGYVHLKKFFDRESTETLKKEIQFALKKGYGPAYEERPHDGGIEGHYITLMADSTPLSRSLVVDDPRLCGIAKELLGRPVLPTLAEGILYFGETGWHRDTGMDMRSVKFVTYFDALHAHNGALRVLPGSHRSRESRDFENYLTNYAYAKDQDDVKRTKDEVPGLCLETQPGDLIAFEYHTWHASFGGKDRCSWTTSFFPAPQGDNETRDYLESMKDVVDKAHHQYDHERFPVYRDWLKGAQIPPAREHAIREMKALGVFDLPGADR